MVKQLAYRLFDNRGCFGGVVDLAYDLVLQSKRSRNKKKDNAKRCSYYAAAYSGVYWSIYFRCHWIYNRFFLKSDFNKKAECRCLDSTDALINTFG